MPSAFCPLPPFACPSRDTGTIASILADIGYVVKKFMYPRGNNFYFRRGMDSLSESFPTQPPSGRKIVAHGASHGGIPPPHEPHQDVRRRASAAGPETAGDVARASCP